LARFPLDSATIASGFGVFRKAQGVFHWGLDVVGKGSVVAPEAMTVVDVATSADPERADNTTLPAPWSGYGPNVVEALGESGAFHVLAHLGSVAVVKGQQLAEGEVVGELATHVGASSPHVHWEMRIVAIDSPTTRGTNTFDPAAWVKSGALVVKTPPMHWLAIVILAWFVFR
jgi:murein DD-endopeptidase MepM/ murein hydrolase activator NlpD